jgi:hypothetical protein
MKVEKEEAMRIKDEQETQQAYNALFKDAKTFEDSLNVYNNNPYLRKKIRLKPVYSLEEMKEAVKQGKLENKLK